MCIEMLKNIYADRAINVKIRNGIVYIVLGNDNLSEKFSPNNRRKDRQITKCVITMPLLGFIKSINLFERFIDRSDTRKILEKYVEIGILKK